MMNTKQSINRKTFVIDVENQLLTEPIAERMTFNEFKGQLWDLFCFIGEDYLKKLHKELNLKYHKNNIGNLQYAVIEKLNLSIYL